MTTPASNPEFPQPGSPGEQTPGAQGPAPVPPAGGRGATDSFFDSVRHSGVARTRERWLGGVAGGLARKLGIDPVLVRCIWAIACLFTGLALVLYGLAWALLPEEEDGRIHAQQALRGDVSAGLAGSIAAVVCGLTGTGSGLIPAFFAGYSYLPLYHFATVAAIITLVVTVLILIIRAVTGRSSGSAGAPSQGAVPPTQGFPTATGAGVSGAAPFTYPTQPRSGQGAVGGDAAASAQSVSRPSPLATQNAQALQYAQAPQNAQPPSQAGSKQAGMPTPVTPAAATAPLSPVPASPYAAPRPLPAPRVRIPGPSRRLTLLVIAAFFIINAGVALFLRGTMSLPGALLMAVGSMSLVLGVGVVICALRGRRGGWMTGIGWLAAMAAVPALIVGSFLPAGSANGAFLTGGKVIRVTGDLLNGGDDINLGAYSGGLITVDLTKLNDADIRDAQLDLTLGAGKVTILTRQGLPLDLESHYSAGTISTKLRGTWEINGASTYTEDDGGPFETFYLGTPLRYDAHGKTLQTIATYEDAPLDSTIRMSSKNPSKGSGRIGLNLKLGVSKLTVIEYPGEVNWQGEKYGDYWIADSWTDAKLNTHVLATHVDEGAVAKVDGLDQPLISSSAAWTCLRKATAWAESEDTSDQNVQDNYLDLYNVDSLSDRSAPAFKTCLDHILKGGSLSEVPDNTNPAPASSSQDEESTDGSPATSSGEADPSAQATPTSTEAK